MAIVPIQTDVVKFVKAGVFGFVLRDAALDDFLHAIRSVAQGAKVLPYFIEKRFSSWRCLELPEEIRLISKVSRDAWGLMEATGKQMTTHKR